MTSRQTALGAAEISMMSTLMNVSFLLLVFSFASVAHSLAKIPSAGPTPTPSIPTVTKVLGSSLEKYDKKQNSQSKEKRADRTDDDVIKVATDLIVNNVLVSNQKGSLILGLQKEDFIVTEDGVPQTINIFSRSEAVPRSIVLIMDDTVANGPYRAKSIEAAKVLVDQLAPEDKLAIVTDVRVWSNFSNDKPLLKQTLDFLNTELDYRFRRDSTRLPKDCQDEFCGLLAVLAEMFDGSERQPIIIFQSGGNQVIFLKPDKDTPYQVSDSTLYKSGLRWVSQSNLPQFGFSLVKRAIERSRVTIYSIIPGLRFIGLAKDEQLARARITIANTNGFYRWNKEGDLTTIIGYYQYAEAETRIAGQTAMFSVAELSGGYADFIEKPEDAENAYSNIFTVINNRYVIGYYPTIKTRDGKRREVKIEVRDHPDYIVTGRKAYSLSP